MADTSAAAAAVKTEAPAADVYTPQEEEFRRLLVNARNIMVLTGAGISAESGVPTFRGAGGFWRKFQAQKLATPEAFRATPSLVWEFYHYRRENMFTKVPNPGHRAVAELQQMVRARGDGRQLYVVTQNIDRLHHRGGAEDVIEMHGTLFKTECTSCHAVEENYDSPICEGLRDRGAPDVENAVPIPEADLPRCKACQGLLRPHVVWFGENLNEGVMMRIGDIMTKCDLCLVIGTSSVVYPAAGFAPRLAARGVAVAEFNIEATEVSEVVRFNFVGPSGEILPRLIRNLPWDAPA